MPRALSSRGGSPACALVLGYDEPSVENEAAKPVPLLQFVSGDDPVGGLIDVRLPPSRRKVEDLLFKRGIHLCHDSVRRWWSKFEPMFAGEIGRQRVSRMRGF